MSPAPAIQYGGAALDLSPRYFKTSTVVASPTAATETIIASLTINENLALMEAVQLWAYAAFTVGTNGVSVTARIRQTDASGSVIASSGAITAVAADLRATSLIAFDTAATVPGQVYVLTLTVASASAGSAVSAVTMAALVI